MRGLSGRVPSLNIESSFGRTFPRFYIRGLGNTDFDLNASQPVSLVYDDVVLENPILKGFPAFDVNRVEVLRGPQGTLFGRNTPAGIVKFDTVRPGSGKKLCQDQLRHLLRRSMPKARSTAEISRYTRGSRLGPVAASQRLDRQSQRIPATTTSRAMTTSRCAPKLQFTPSDALTHPPDRPGPRPRRRCAHFPRQRDSAQAANELVGVDGGDFERDEVRADGLNFQKLQARRNAAGTVEYDFGPVTLYSITSYWNGKLAEPGRHRRRLRLFLLWSGLFEQ